MNCKFCGGEIAPEQNFCPNCGEKLLEENASMEQPLEEIVVPEETAEVVIPEQVAAAAFQMQELQEDVETPCEETVEQKPKKKVWKWVLAISGAVVALGVLAGVLLVALGVDIVPDGVKSLFRENDVNKKDVYLVSDEKAADQAEKVIAKIGEKELTNGQLQIYYKMQVQDFLSYYGSYLSSVGLDYTKPLDEQKCYLDEKLTWEQYFLQMALETWQNYQTVALMAEEAKFSVSEETETELAALPEALEEQAAEGGYKNAQEMVEEILGAGCTVEDYLEYVELVTVSNDFYASEYQRLTPTEEEVEAYFKENEKTFAESGITKESGLVSSVRHILIAPEGGETDEETGETTYSDKELAAAKKKAEKLLKAWKKGAATEESFAALVQDNTDDTGSAETGGLYEGITPTSNYVENFLKWSVDMSRKTGDTEIVETEFGYHIMYFVSGEPHWKQEAGTMLLSERTTKMIEDAEAKWPMVVNYSKIILTALDLA